MTKHLSPQWQTWIQENLARGCDVDAMLHAMVQQDFAPEDALAAIDYFSKHTESHVLLVPADKAPLSKQAEEYAVGTPAIFSSKQNIVQLAEHVVQVRLRLTRPRIVVFDHVLTEAECDELIRLSKVKLSRSTIVDPLTGREEIIQDRTSSGTFFHLSENAFIARLDQRISQLMNFPTENGEGLQILNYQIGGEYKPHFDFFPPNDVGSQHHLRMGGQRASTLVIYLNEPDEGGETSFPEVGLSITPKKGAAVYFEYSNQRGQVDRLSLHAGEPVRRGEKWIATKWMRWQKYG
jgi:prolyl 4-hydroxylase